MPVGADHPSCFTASGHLYVVPSDSGLSRDEVRERWPGAGRHRRVRLGDVWLLTGGVTGGVFLASVAGGVWHATSVLSLVAFFVAGGLVGAVLAVGTRKLFDDDDAAGTGEADRRRRGSARHPEPLHVVQVPWDVAWAAPADATGDELALWSTLVVRYRDARAAFASGESPAGDPSRTGDDGPSASEEIARLESEYRAATAAYEPVAQLLGLQDR
jgi:hypothetical protein